MPLSSNDINRLQSRSMRSGLHKGYYGFRRAMGVSRQMRDILRRLDEHDAIDDDLYKQLETIFDSLSTVEAGAGAIMSYISAGVVSAAAWAIHPALGAATMGLTAATRGLRGGRQAVDIITKSALQYGAVKDPLGGLVFTGPGGGRVQFDRWWKEQRWKLALSLATLG